MTANAVAVRPAANVTARPSGLKRIAIAPTDSSSSDTPTSIASAPHRLQRMARIVTCRSTGPQPR